MSNYVKVFRGHDVPYGATKYQEDTGRFHESFWDNDGNVWVIGICEKWVKAASITPENLIPLPEEPKWMPVAGKGCEVFHDDKWIECFYIGFDINNDHVYQFASDFGMHKSYLNVFRPLKTAEEKKREAFIERAKPILDKHGDSGHKAFFGAMFDDGFTAPDGEL